MATAAGVKTFSTLSFKGRCTALLAIICVLLYANTLRNGFVLDDNTAIIGNHIVTKGAAAIPEIFSTPYLQGFGYTKHGLYRPLPLSMFAIEWQLSNGTPALSHLINVLFFMACVVSLFFFLDELLDGRKTVVAFAAALLFSVHPIHTEVVANIKSRDELLCFFFSMLALRMYARYVRNGSPLNLASATLAYFLSLLSKESSISLVLLIPFTAFFFLNGPKSRKWTVTFAAVMAAIIFVAIRSAVLSAYNADYVGGISLSENALAAATGFWQREATAFLMLGKYLGLLFVPYPLICDYSYNAIPLVSLSNGWVITSLAVYVLMLVFVVHRMTRYRQDVFAYGIAFYLLTLALFSNVFFLLSATMGERFLFFPSAGFCLVCAQFFNNVFRIDETTFVSNINLKKSGVLLLILLVFSILTIGRNSDWKDGYTLFRTDIRHEPQSYRLLHYLGYETANSIKNEPDSFTRRERAKRVIEYLSQATTILPDYDAMPYQIIGMSYTELGMADSAEQYYLHAFRLGGRDSLLLNNLAGIYFKKGQYEVCIQLCKQNSALYPEYGRAYLNMGAAYLKMAKYDSAGMALKSAVMLEPDNRMAQYYLSVANQYADSVKQK